MIPVTTKAATTEGSLPSVASAKFSISETSASFIMRTMADLYSNRELAVVREYSTNAFDANKELAILEGRDPEPIKVTLPNLYDHFFTVEDQGIGMSLDELIQVYTKFGESTKRNSNDFNGMLGFGSKAAIAYTNVFTVTAIKGGWRSVATINREEDSMSGYNVTLNVVEHEKTDEHSGVKITIPVHNQREFTQKANDFYRFWRSGEVLVNGKPPTGVIGEQIGDDLYYYNANNNHGENPSYVVMGNVPYRVANPRALFPREVQQIPFVAYVANGAVEFTPSREDLKYSDHTKRALHTIIDNFVKTSKAKAESEIKTAKSHAEALKMYIKWRKVLGHTALSSLRYNGDEFVSRIKQEGWLYNRNMSRYAVTAVEWLNIDEDGRTLYITGMPDGTSAVTTPQRTKARAWADAFRASKGFRYIFFTKSKSIDTPWIGADSVVSWEKVKEEAPKPAPKPRVQSTAPGRLAGSFDLLSTTGRESEKDVPTTGTLYYILVGELNSLNARTYISIPALLKKFGVSEKVVIVPANREAKFLRNYPKATKVIDYLESKVVWDGAKTLSDDAKFFLGCSNYQVRNYSKYKPSDFDDPNISTFIERMKKGQAEQAEYERNMELATALGASNKFKKFVATNSNADPVSNANYPLASLHYQTEHSKIYINAVYAARKAGKNV